MGSVFFRCWIVLTFIGAACAGGGIAVAADAPDFTGEVRPILSHHCLKCHGPDDGSRKGNLRLDIADSETVAAKSKKLAIVVGHPELSELVKRIDSADVSTIMPPPETKNPLTDKERDILKRWIASGGVYKEHWAFVPPVQAALPGVHHAQWVKNPIDHFVLTKLEAAKIEPSPEADRETLLRRVYLDLIGLPPTPGEIEAFLKDNSPAAYEKVVDTLLANPHYGERWARRWLDLARYADTNGYEKDRPRSIYLYRDWVINALNSDMPFDEFTIEQLAGDMLPNATDAQRVATGFHRNTMLNEEGGVDPLEFRWKAVVDRNNTTATTWLGLTLGCAQCHTHKFDPIPHREYYQMMAFFNNANEPTMPIAQPGQAEQRERILKQIAGAEVALPAQYPIALSPVAWHVASDLHVTTTSNSAAVSLPDGSVRLAGPIPERDDATITFDVVSAGPVSQLRLEAIQDDALPSHGPGRAPNGNFVLNHIAVSVAPVGAPNQSQDVPIVSATANYSQPQFDVASSLGENPTTGWAGDDHGHMGPRDATFTFAGPVAPQPGGTRWTIHLQQQYGGGHTLGRFRFSLGEQLPSPNPMSDKPIAVQRHDALDRAVAAWVETQSPAAQHWTVLKPMAMKSNIASFTLLPDNSVLVSGDMTKRDVYDLRYHIDAHAITAIRLEAIPDASLPDHGPGRTAYEGTFGDFFLSELSAMSGGKPVKFSVASASPQDNGVGGAVDGNPLTGWNVANTIGRRSVAVFTFAAPVDGDDLALSMVFEKYFASALGRFRISVTTDAKPRPAHDMPADVESILAKLPAGAAPQAGLASLPPADRTTLESYYLSIAPETAPERAAIDSLRRQIPAFPTTLVMQERPDSETRPTFLHHRGEFLQPEQQVQPNVLSVLPPLPKDAPHNRLTLARWLVDGKNPLTARVAVNRQWAALLGAGIVKTTQDFGYQGDPPTHPQLLDWLAVAFQTPEKKGGLGWSMKKLDRLIVTSATYRQSDHLTPDLLERDPDDSLLSRAPRFRLDAELVRDYALSVSGLLSPKMFGPSVFPPQPASVTTEGSYGSLAWNVSGGEDRYRRGLYTFMKRTAPYAMFTTFDAPSGEACVARRDVSDTPLQALALLNDSVFTETSMALGKIGAADPGPTTADRASHLFERIVCRIPSDDERTMVVKYYEKQHGRLERKELNAEQLAGPGDNAIDRAAWTLVARSLLNLDETVTRN